MLSETSEMSLDLSGMGAEKTPVGPKDVKADLGTGRNTCGAITAVAATASLGDNLVGDSGPKLMRFNL
jgi:hypothetical protein